MKAVLLLFSLSLFLASTCEDAATFPLGESFTMSPQQELVNKPADITIKWLEVSEDSRCPKNTNCVWEGQAIVNLLVNGGPVTLTLRSGKPDKAQTLVGEYIFTAETLSPYPEGDKIEPADYRLQLKVSSL
jgi:hypothetical protein